MQLFSKNTDWEANKNNGKIKFGKLTKKLILGKKSDRKIIQKIDQWLEEEK